jgi:hypothetical protein
MTKRGPRRHDEGKLQPEDRSVEKRILDGIGRSR